jgi:hypothetical protein
MPTSATLGQRTVFGAEEDRARRVKDLAAFDPYSTSV